MEHALVRIQHLVKAAACRAQVAPKEQQNKRLCSIREPVDWGQHLLGDRVHHVEVVLVDGRARSQAALAKVLRWDKLGKRVHAGHKAQHEGGGGKVASRSFVLCQP